MDLILSILGKLLPGLVGRWLGSELAAWHQPLCRWLVRVAASRQPSEERAALEAEWLAVIDDLKSPTLQLLHAASFVLSALSVRDAMEEDDEKDLRKAARKLHFFVSGISAGVSTTLITVHFSRFEELIVQLAPNKWIVILVTVSLVAILPWTVRRSERAFIRLIKNFRMRRVRNG
ncbi:cytochrome bd-type quinol oxidase subunit 2 [Bradyrhizobium japonicum]|uniref:hypothetical protein n=1 Tax=Bradyrhizobium japonicum TaxID=375 RepID=UPI002226E890|nr:hypothetical protein [Bradyrhizobium japonicum]MCW2218780.1 cytochrome bd-type quinol oxidase subunit 2 [Bradyrhizobium japonicum]MCW2343394.1 cytochrome bd-type quinol oxidase subunit 2 [Bradyrhizobium japonicum]